MRVPLIEGEEPEPRDRVLVAADSGNGVSAPLDYHRWLFINADLNVALRRPPRGRVGLPRRDHLGRARRRRASPTPRSTTSEGLIGRATQSLLVAPR